jgi:hypothetical protein
MIDPQLNDELTTSPVPERTLRSFAALCFGVLGSLFGLSWYRHGGEPTPAAWLGLAVAVLVGIPGLIKPSLIRPLFVAAMAMTRPIGRVMNVVLLGALYYGVVTPLALVFRLAGRDVLGRQRPSAATYWIAKDPDRDVRRYLRQYQKQ